jgi:hypothetical protein
MLALLTASDPVAVDSITLRTVDGATFSFGRSGAVATLVLALAPAATIAQVLPPEDTARLRIYYEAIGPAVERLPAQVAIADVATPLFRLSASRSTDNPAPAENRAALIAIALYVNGRDPARLIPDAAGWRRPAWRRVALAGRRDLVQHFTISAAVAAAAGPLADLIGIYKELEDARGGGGFSFSDLAADRAGAAFGAAATVSADSAQRLQARLARGFVDADIMPSVAGLPPDLSEREFTRRYLGENDVAFRAVLAEIDRRIAALPIFDGVRGAGPLPRRGV